jgi:Ca-activated chloride channel family protein
VRSARHDFATIIPSVRRDWVAPPPQRGRILISMKQLMLVLLLLPLSLSAQELLIKTGETLTPTPALETTAHLRIRGLVLRGEVTQKFHNDGASCVEAVYSFPLPENAAVDTLRMKVGARVIEGEIKEKGEAHQVYEQAKSEGKKASLLDQQKRNIFKVAIANIGAKEDVVVTIEYQQTVDYRDGIFSVRFPMTIAPRYKDVSQVAPPTVSAPDRLNRIKLDVDLDSGFSLREVTSNYHEVDTTVISGSHRTLKLRGDSVVADRDFELVWRPDLGSEPKSALFTESSKDGTYALIMLMPPKASEGARLPKESIFVIDTSGSMEGTSMNEAKNALQFALGRLSPLDRFNVIEFNSTARAMFEKSQDATPDALEHAKQWVGALQANGGTEMKEALQLALPGDNASSESKSVRQVVFMTDGQVGNEEELFGFIRNHLGRSRLFTVGIGAAPNSNFMRNAARFGRGTYTYVGSVNEVQEKMTSLFTKLESPVLTNVEVRFDDPSAEVFPQRVPDLYVGEPVIVTARLSKASGRAIVSGSIGQREWSDTQDVAPPPSVATASATLGGVATESGLGKLWAREKIESLTDRNAIIKLGLEHHLVTEHTSLVAVDVTPASVPQETCESKAVPANLAAGWGGTLPATGTPAPLLMLLGVCFIAVAIFIGRT